MTESNEPRYHVALSYASEDREYVSKVAAALAARGVRYFYDQEEQVQLWGTHLNEKLGEIYLQDSASVLIFISEWYAGKPWPNQERRMALIRAMEDPESVLSARFDDTQVRGILPDVYSMSAADVPPEALAQLVVEKLLRRGVLISGQAKPIMKIALPEELTHLLSMLKPIISQFTYQHDRFRGPSLASMHVRQSVTSHASRKPVEELFDDDKLFDKSRLLTGLAQPFDEVLDRHDHLVIEGAAGHGKTTLGRHVALELTRALLEPEATPGVAPTAIPLMLPARVLANYISKLTWEDALFAAAVEEYGNQVVGRMPAELFKQRVAGLPWLFVVDAIDEIPEEELCDQLLNVLAGRMALPDNAAKFLITSRPLVRGQIAHLQGPLTGLYQLEPFDEEGLRRLAYKWFAREGVQTAEDFLSQVQEAALGEVLRVPLLASIAADVFEAHPDRRLPASRYELYEQCIAQLAKRREQQREDVLMALASTLNGPELAKWLKSNGDLLLEELASAYTTGQTSLRLILRSALPMPTSPEGEARIEEWLSHTGLLNPSSGRLRFQHQTFAEHLHANARARSLPSFQPDARQWEVLIRGVLLGKPDDERVLLHYLHRYDADDNAVLTWLQQGTRNQREAAGRLIVAGAPILKVHLSNYLEDVARLLILGDMSRERIAAISALTRHSSVCDQLARLLDDDSISDIHKIAIAEVLRGSSEGNQKAPRLLEELTRRLRSAHMRFYAAETLAKFGGTHRERAGAVLAYVAGDPTADMDDRVIAAVGLLKIGNVYRAAVIEAFRAVIATSAEYCPTRIRAAVELAKVDQEHRTEAAQALSAISCRVSEDSDDRLSSLKELAGMGTEHRRTAGEILSQWAEDPNASRYDRALALTELAGIERAYRQTAADRLVDLALDRAVDVQHRITASDELLKLGSEYRQRAADGYLNVLNDSTADFWARASVVESVIKLGGENFVEEGAQAWRNMAREPLARGWTRYFIYVELATLSDAYQSEAAQELADFANDPSEAGRHRRLAALALANLSERRLTQSVEMFARQVDSPHSSAADRLLAAMVLVALRPGAEYMVAALLFQIASATTASVEIRLGVVNAMAELGRCGASRRSLLHELSRDCGVDASDRVELLRELIHLGDEDRRVAVPVLIELINDPSISAGDRIDAAVVLGAEPFEQRDASVQMLVAFGTDAAAEHGVRVRAASALANLGEDLHSHAARLYREVAEDESAGTPQRQYAVRMLATLNVEYRAEAVDLLRKLAHATSSSCSDRIELAGELARISSACLAEAANWLVDVADNPEIDAAQRRHAIAELATLGSAFEVTAMDLLSRLATQLDPLGLEHALTAVTLAAIDPDRCLDALESLYRIAVCQDADLVDRRLALNELVSLRGDFSGRVAAMLLELSTDPAWEAEDRVRLCERLASLGAHRARTLAILRAAAQDSATVVSIRVQAAEWLTRLGSCEFSATLLQNLAADSSVRVADRRSVAHALAHQSCSQDQIIAVLTELAHSEDNSAFSRRSAAIELINTNSHGRVAAESLLSVLARDERCDDWNRFWAAQELASLGRSAQITATEVFQALASIADGGSLSAAMALSELAKLDETHHMRAVNALANVRETGVERLHAAAALLDLSRHHLVHAAELTKEVAEDRSLRCWERRLAVGALVNFGPNFRGAATSVLAEMIDDPRADPWERAEACHALARFDPLRRRHVIAVLRGLSSVSVPGDQRVRVLELAADMGPDCRSEATAVLRILTADPEMQAADRARACFRLARLDWSARTVACDLLLEIGENEDLAVSDRRAAAVLLAGFGQKSEAAAIGVLRKLATGGTVIDQALTRCGLVKLGTTEWSVARAALRRAGEMLGPSEQWLIARASAESDSDSKWSALRFLQRAVTSDMSASNRLTAVTDLAALVSRDSMVEARDLSPVKLVPPSRFFHQGLF